MTTSLLDLPQELVVEILSETDPVTLFRSASVSGRSAILEYVTLKSDTRDLESPSSDSLRLLTAPLYY